MFFSHLTPVLSTFLAASVPVHGKCFKRPDEYGHMDWPKDKIEMKKKMFKYCSDLKSINIPAEVELVDDGAFFRSGLNLLELTAASREMTAGWAERAAEWAELTAECMERPAEWAERTAEWSEKVSECYTERDDRISELQDKVYERDGRISILQEKASEKDAQILELGKRIIALEGRAAELEGRCGETAPSTSPMLSPTASPTHAPTLSPSDHPTGSLSLFPTASPTDALTLSPSDSPSDSRSPSLSLTTSPTNAPTTECETPCTSTALVKIPSGNATFGYSIAIAGDTLVVGSPDAYGVALQKGAAYVFSRKTSGTWEEMQELVSLDGDRQHHFSQENIAFDGDTMLIGAYGASKYTGAAYVFTLQAGLWKQKQKLTAKDGEKNDRFGYDVAVHGDTLVVGAYGHQRYHGAAYIFSLQDGTWMQTDKLMALDKAKAAGFGNAVAVSPGLIAVSAWRHNQGESEVGAVYVYTPDTSGNWTQAQKLLASDGKGFDHFGTSVAASDDGTLFVGVPSHNETGSVYVFSCSTAGMCTETDVLRAVDGVAGDSFGESIATSCNTVVVGAIGTNENSGSVYTFTRQLAGGWVETSKIVATDGEQEKKFGSQVAISTHTVAVLEKIKGSAYVKEVCDS